MLKLKDRISSYEDSVNYKLLPKVPLVLIINGKNFNNVTNLLDKPFDKSLYNCLSSTMKRLCSEIEGAVVGYLYNDSIVVISRNDQNLNTIPWFNNNLQKLTSVSASLATAHFIKCANNVGLQLSGEPLFTSKAFPLPSVSEAINSLVHYQQLNFMISIQFSCYYELINKFDKPDIKRKLFNLNQVERIDLLKTECGVDFEDYHSSFKRGSVCFKNIIGSEDESHTKSEWVVANNLPIFTENQGFLKDIFT